VASADFIDEVKIYTRAGHGGAGSVHFRREKFVPKGGPDGGDGGKGGDIILVGNSQLSTLLHLKYQKHIVAEDGKSGEGGCRKGADGLQVILEVPLGTVAKEADTNRLIIDITQEGQQAILMRGGRGGLGNVHFKTATQQSPRYAQPGEPGDESWIKLELKLLAEVGLVGLPNAGKSTLLASISAAKPKIDNYPFTTLVPQLGVVPYRAGNSFVLADLPGIIEGAAMGKGLGIRFLKHIERNLILGFVIAADTPDIYPTYLMLQKELQGYSNEMLHKPAFLVISKSDLITEEEKLQIKKSLPSNLEPIFISAITEKGLDLLKDKIWQLLHPDSLEKSVTLTNNAPHSFT
jgi:GTP-binding protein